MQTNSPEARWSQVGDEMSWNLGSPHPEGDDSSTPRILVAYNGTRTARAALDVAAHWAIALRAETWVLYVRVCDVSRGGHYYVDSPAEAHALATDAVLHLRARGVSASGMVRSKDRRRIAPTILASADALDVRMILLGTHAGGIVRAALLGSTSRSVARHADRPLVLVKPTGTPSLASMDHSRSLGRPRHSSPSHS